MPTNDERREVAARLRELAQDSARCGDDGVGERACRVLLGPRVDLLDVVDAHFTLTRLADLIEPEERTCHIEPLSLREFFAGEKYVLTSEAMESAEDERFDSLSREIEADARFTCSSCHVLFGTHEVANADYDILEDGTYEVSGVTPIIKFCPNCGALVVADA